MILWPLCRHWSPLPLWATPVCCCDFGMVAMVSLLPVILPAAAGMMMKLLLLLVVELSLMLMLVVSVFVSEGRRHPLLLLGHFLAYVWDFRL